MLLLNGVDIHFKDQFGDTPLLVATRSGIFKINLPFKPKFANSLKFFQSKLK